MGNSIEVIEMERLSYHPDNPNRMSGENFRRLLRNIERSGRYEPLIVRPHPERAGDFQIINGHHRHKALSRLGCKRAECIVWEVDDEQTDILLATLNRLCGQDVLGKKIALLKRLSKMYRARELSKLLPQSGAQIERLLNLKMPAAPAAAEALDLKPVVFFVSRGQERLIEKALEAAGEGVKKETAAARRAAGLVKMARYFIKGEFTKKRHTKK